MSHDNHYGETFEALAFVAAIAFAFGTRTARIVVGSALIAVTVFCAYVMFRVVMGTI